MNLKITRMEMVCFILVLLIGIALGWYLAQLLQPSNPWQTIPTPTLIPTPVHPIIVGMAIPWIPTE